MIIENRTTEGVTPQELMPLKKILKEKYPDLDIDEMFREEEFNSIINMLLTR